MKKISYPFTPKSTAYLIPGQFWPIPLSNGKFACGRVIELYQTKKGCHSRLFLAGVMDWCDDSEPTTESIAGCKTLRQTITHIRAITIAGKQITGCRSLELDGLEPDYFLSQVYRDGCKLMKGCTYLRDITDQEYSLYKVISISTEGVINGFAERYFLSKP